MLGSFTASASYAAWVRTVQLGVAAAPWGPWGPGGASGTDRALVALDALGAGIAFGTLGALEALRTGGALGALSTGSALGALGPCGADGADLTLGALGASKVEGTRPVERGVVEGGHQYSPRPEGAGIEMRPDQASSRACWAMAAACSSARLA